MSTNKGSSEITGLLSVFGEREASYCKLLLASALGMVAKYHAALLAIIKSCAKLASSAVQEAAPLSAGPLKSRSSALCKRQLSA
jgi:hypothetical protein